VSECTLALTGLADRAFLVAGAEQLAGSKGEPAAVARVVAEALINVEVNGDLHAPAEYRRHLAAVAAHRAVAKAMKQAEGR
jgi:CO/xanthine dehydrogenase FAD-binding subunit